MTPQFETFCRWFADYQDCYVIIGGTAVQLLQERAGQVARRTRDVDMVLLVEGHSHPFYRHFWDFIRRGGYEAGRKANGEGRFYRFRKPKEKDFPQEIELFSREPADFAVAEGCTLVPIPTDDGVSSLSAILLNKDYDTFLRNGVVRAHGVPILDEWHLIPMKARAWLDLSARRMSGEPVDRSDIEKHRKDIFRVAYYMPPTPPAAMMPESIRQDMIDFLQAMAAAPFDASTLGIRMPFHAMMLHLATLYGLEDYLPQSTPKNTP